MNFNMDYIKNNLEKINASFTGDVTLVAVSKTKPIADLQEAYDADQRIFGENKIQEMVTKYDTLPKDIKWHMIGHLQSNKVKYMAHFVDLIHGEETKFGLPYIEISDILNSEECKNLSNVSIVGFMGMATFTDDKAILNEEFSTLKVFFDEQKKQTPELEILSMGMSGDYQIAIENGSTMIRVGSKIFGERNY